MQYSAPDQPILWPDLGEISCFDADRPFTPEDLKKHEYALFFISPSTSARRLKLTVPQYALVIYENYLAPAMLIQAEGGFSDSGEWLEYGAVTHLSPAWNELLPLSRLVLLGNESPPLTGKTAEQLFLEHGSGHAYTPQQGLHRRQPAPEVLMGTHGFSGQRIEWWYSRWFLQPYPTKAPSKAAHPADHYIDWLDTQPSNARYRGQTLADFLAEHRQPLPIDTQKALDRLRYDVALRLSQQSPHRAFCRVEISLGSGLQRWLKSQALNRKTAAQWRGEIRNHPGLSRIESDWGGLDGFLDARNQPYSGQDLLKHLHLDRLQPEVFIEHYRNSPWQPQQSEYTPQNYRQLAHWQYGMTRRLFPALPLVRQGRTYFEGRVVIPHDPRTVPNTHFSRFNNTLAHFRTTLHRSDDGTPLFLIDEVQSEWPTRLTQHYYCGPSVCASPYRQQWLAATVRALLLVLADELRYQPLGFPQVRVGWLDGTTQEHLHFEGKLSAGIHDLYNQRLPEAVIDALRIADLPAQPEQGKIMVCDPDWSIRRQNQQSALYYQGEAQANSTFDRPFDALHYLQNNTAAVPQGLTYISLKRREWQRLAKRGLPFLGSFWG
jgi:hypothetical protein